MSDGAQLPASAVPNAEYVAQMTGATLPEPNIAQQPAPGPQRPENVPEQFWDAAKGTVNTEALLKSYGDLRTAFNQKQPTGEKPAEEAPAQKPGTKIERPGDGEATTADKSGEQANDPPPALELESFHGLLNTVRDSYAASGEVGPEQATELAKYIPQEFLNVYFEGLKAIEGSITLAAHEVAGGAEKFEAMRSWAATALTDAELDHYNGMVGDASKAKVATEWLAAKFSAANPGEGNFITAEPSNVSGDTYDSQEQLIADQSSAQYRTDSAFRRTVAEKYQRSIRAGTMQKQVRHYRAS